MDLDHLKALANQSLIAPEDLVQVDEGPWNKAPEVAGLEMLWWVEPLDGPRYGPTTAGTVAEFLQSEYTSIYHPFFLNTTGVYQTCYLTELYTCKT